jgi:hypothetical protein
MDCSRSRNNRSPIMTYASSGERNHSRLGLQGKFRDKCAVTPFCEGLPGSIDAVAMPCGYDPRQQRFRHELRTVVAAQEGRATRSLTSCDGTSMTRGMDHYSLAGRNSAF